jgi:hypothetical protein
MSGLLDEFGKPYGVKQINGKPRVSSMPYLFDIAEGNVPDHVAWSKVGYSPASTASQTTLWVPGTEYVWPIGEQQMEVRANSGDDTAAGPGAQSVWFKYTNLLGHEKTETVSLAGAANVDTVATDIYRINGFRVASTGANGKPTALIDIRNRADHTTVYSRIGAGMTRARNSVYTIPRGWTLYVTSIAFSASYSSAGKSVRFTTQATWDNERKAALTRGIFFMPYSEVQLVDSAYTKTLEIPTRLPENTDIKVSVIGEANAICTSALRGWLEKN